MPAPPDSGTGQDRGDAARVRCLYCGANNFPSSATCWQCGRPLRALGSGTPAGQAGPSTSVGASPAYVRPITSGATEDVHPGLAPKAAAALGLMFPYIGLPVGIVFLMLDDARKARLGWITIGWSVLGSVLNLIALLVTLGPTLALLKSMLPGGGHGGGLPGVPSPAGGDSDLLNLLTALFSVHSLLV